MSYAHSAVHSFIWLNRKLCLLSEGLIHHATNKWLIPILNSCNTYSLEESCCVAPVGDVCGSLWGGEGSSLRGGRLSKLNALLSRARLPFCPTNNKSGVHEGELSLNSLFPSSFINYSDKKEREGTFPTESVELWSLLFRNTFIKVIMMFSRLFMFQFIIKKSLNSKASQISNKK